MNTMKTLLYCIIALVFTISSANVIANDISSSLSVNTLLQLEFIPHTNRFAGVYWLPDYIEHNRGLGYGGRVNDSDAPSGITVKCSDYGKLSCSSPKIGVGSGSKPFLGSSMICFDSCKCPSVSNCNASFSYNQLPANAVTFSCNIIDASSCAISATKYKITACNDGYTRDLSGCGIRPCPKDFTAGLSKCPNSTDIYTTDGKSGAQICGKCTNGCSDTYIYDACPIGAICSEPCGGKYAVTNCKEGYKVGTDATLCVEKECISPYIAGVERCSNSWDSYSHNGKSGEKTCGKCTCTPTPDATGCTNGTTDVDNGCGGTYKKCNACTPKTDETNCTNGTTDGDNGCGGTYKICNPKAVETCEEKGYRPATFNIYGYHDCKLIDTTAGKCYQDCKVDCSQGYYLNTTCAKYEQVDNITTADDEQCTRCTGTCRSNVQRNYVDRFPEEYHVDTKGNFVFGSCKYGICFGKFMTTHDMINASDIPETVDGLTVCSIGNTSISKCHVNRIIYKDNSPKYIPSTSYAILDFSSLTNKRDFYMHPPKCAEDYRSSFGIPEFYASIITNNSATPTLVFNAKRLSSIKLVEYPKDLARGFENYNSFYPGDDGLSYEDYINAPRELNLRFVDTPGYISNYGIAYGNGNYKPDYEPELHINKLEVKGEYIQIINFKPIYINDLIIDGAKVDHGSVSPVYIKNLTMRNGALLYNGTLNGNSTNLHIENRVSISGDSVIR